MGHGVDDLTDRQKKWFASVRANLEARTGKSMEQWVAIARTCPHAAPRARQAWLLEQHGLGQNHASYVLGEAFPSADPTWREPEALRAALWTDPASLAILEAVETAVADFPDLVRGQRKGFTAFSRKVQFASVKPLKGGAASLGLGVAPDLSPRLSPAGKESWSERLKAVVRLAGPGEVDGEVAGLLRKAWEGA